MTAYRRWPRGVIAWTLRIVRRIVHIGDPLEQVARHIRCADPTPAYRIAATGYCALAGLCTSGSVTQQVIETFEQGTWDFNHIGIMGRH